MAEITCPHCLNINRVAGYVSPGSTVEGTARQRLYCGFCGRTFEPAVAPPH